MPNQENTTPLTEAICLFQIHVVESVLPKSPTSMVTIIGFSITYGLTYVIFL